MWERRRAYFHKSYNHPPNTSVTSTKHIPFAFLVGDLPVHVAITQLKAENSNEFHDIVPIFGPFHTHCLMMSAIYKHYKGSGLEEELVAGGVTAEGSVEHKLKGKHYQRGLRC